MHGWETRMLLKHNLDQGVSKAELSRRFGVSRRTIHSWIESGQLDRDLSSGESSYTPRPRVAHKLDPYKGIIHERLEQFPKLSAQRLFDEVRASGYPGGYSRVRDYVREVRPREPADAVVRFETPAGRQGQVDFGTFRLPWGRRRGADAERGVLALCRTLGVHAALVPTVPGADQGQCGAADPFPSGEFFTPARSSTIRI